MKDLILSERHMVIVEADKQFIHRTITAWLAKELHK